MTEKQLLVELMQQGGQQTVSHVKKVAEYMRAFAVILGEDANLWYYGGLLHDAGKLFVSKEILNGTGKLSHQQYEAIKKHSVAGAGIIKSMYAITDEQKKIGMICADFHHAWYNGRYDKEYERGGYFRGMQYVDEFTFKSEAIPLVARACAVCDVYEALTAERSYSERKSQEEAVKILYDGVANGQFDINLVNKFVKYILKLDLAKYIGYAV